MNRTKKQQPGDATPTVFLHGFSGDGEGLRKFADAYVGKDAVCLNLPGFGGAPAPSAKNSSDVRLYCRDVWTELRKAVPVGNVRLVGHSHGAMIGYVLATQYPDEITRLDLFCPVARPRFIPRMAIHGVHMLRRLGVPAPLIVRFFAHPLLVSLVTRYSFRREWSHKIRQQIVRMRQRESRYYSPVLFDMMEQTLRFMRDMGDSFAAVPTNIYHVTDDNVAGDNDYRWYQRHANTQTIQAMTGGHLCVVADPARVVALLNERGN